MYMKLTEFLEKHNIPYDMDVELKKKTWIRRGGLVRFWLKPMDVRQLELICKYLFSKKTKFEVIGHTSNLYF